MTLHFHVLVPDGGFEEYSGFVAMYEQANRQPTTIATSMALVP